MQCSHRNLKAPLIRARVNLWLLILALLLPFGSLQAEDTNNTSTTTESMDDRRWYQLEILIFAQGKELAGAEHWRSDPILSYPTNWVTLKDPAVLSDRMKTLETTQQPSYLVSDLDNEPKATDATESSTPTNAEDAAQSEIVTVDTPLFEDESIVQAAQTAALEHMVTVDFEREPFYLLPDELRSLTEKASLIRRSRNYRVLFHAAWRQPLVAPEQSPAILIKGGRQFGEHRELEGSIAIGVSRYLHLNTNLWFTQFTDNFGQESDWPQLPSSPDQILISDGTSVYGDIWAERESGLKTGLTDKVEMTDTNSLAMEFELPPVGVSALGSRYQQLLDTPYLPERITLMQQKRRMRSGEVHYLDHPHLGIVILCKPHETAVAEELQPETE